MKIYANFYIRHFIPGIGNGNQVLELFLIVVLKDACKILL